MDRDDMSDPALDLMGEVYDESQDAHDALLGELDVDREASSPIVLDIPSTEPDSSRDTPTPTTSGTKVRR